ncbi:hypothetical protein Ptr902_12637 [Pyrenophora tritici-repentis]|nr:hypothetical protein L13192_08001 [Pyrenophora tritici-repentis]KAI2475998.1 hypothetical protein Ptr902_12637 [Pyrenophora tritici-repentis]
MLLSVVIVSWLLATFTSALPVRSEGGNGLRAVEDTKIITPELTHRTCLNLEARSANEEEIKACNLLLADKVSLQIRDLKKGTWSTDEWDMLQEASETDVTFDNLMSTLSTLSKLLDASKIPWSISGGLGLKLYGQKRETADIDILVQTDMAKLQVALAKDKKFIGPDFSKPGAAHLRVYHNQGTDATPKYIELDMIIAGNLITPADLSKNSQDIKQKTKDGKTLTVHVLNLGKIFWSKVYALASSLRKKDDKDVADISWIIETNPASLKDVETDLTYDLRKLVIDHLKTRKSPLLETARKLLKVKPDVATAPAGKVPAPASKVPAKKPTVKSLKTARQLLKV